MADLSIELDYKTVVFIIDSQRSDIPLDLKQLYLDMICQLLGIQLIC